MDNGVLSEESSLELVRELLITISYSLPDKNVDSIVENLSSKEGGAKNSIDRADDLSLLRSKLISISNYQSPDFGVTMCNGHP